MTPFILSTFQDVSPLISQDGNISVANFINHGDSIRDLERSVGGHLGTRRKKRSQRMAKTENYSRQVRKICLAFKTLLVFRMPPVPLKTPLRLSCQCWGCRFHRFGGFDHALPVLALNFNPKSLQTGVGIRLLTAGVLLGCPRRLVNGL